MTHLRSVEDADNTDTGEAEAPVVEPGVLPHPERVPTMPLWPDVGRDVLHLGRSATYECARRGEIPTVKFGHALRVPTAALRRLLGMDS